MNETLIPSDQNPPRPPESDNGEIAEETPSAIDLLGPPKVDALSFGLATIGSMVAWFCGGVVIFAGFLFFLNATRNASPGIFPLALAVFGFFANLTASYLSLLFNRLVFPNKYKEGMATFGQTFILSILIFVLSVPMYSYIGMAHPERLAYAFVVQILAGSLGVSLISEILSNYRYAILSVYSSFTGFLLSSFAALAVFMNFGESDRIMYALIGTIFVTTVAINVARLLVEMAYSAFYRSTGIDPLGDIYSRIEIEERESIEQAEAELTKFQ